MRVARLYTADDIRIEETVMPEPGPGEALVRTRACGICTGDIMGWYMQRKAPLVFGHEPAGDVVRVGQGVARVRAGDRVFAHHHAPCGACRLCLRGDYVHCKTWRKTNLKPGGMAEYFVVPAPNVAADTLRLPDHLGYEAASLIEPLACVVKSLRRGNVCEGHTVVVIGAGIMGQLHVVLAAAAGARVIVADRVPFRLERARELGAAATVHVDEQDLTAAVSELTGGDLADVVIVGPGSTDAMEAGIAVAGAGSRVVLFTTSTPEGVLPVRPFRLYFDEISLVPSYSCGPDDTRRALELLDRKTIPVEKLITHRFKLDEVGSAMKAAANVNEALKTVIVFD
jgi:L-iditol 2-dehydrogenase